MWGDVGLVLKAKHGGEEGMGGRVSYFLHHKDLASEMVKVVSGRVPVVEFRGLEVVLDFCSGRRVGGLGRKKKGRGRKVPVVVEEPKTLVQGGPRYALRPRSATAVRNAAVDEDDGREDEAPQGYAWSIREMTTMVDVGLRKLLGVGKGPQGFRTSKSGPSPSLMDIAPSVWNLQYLQARYLPRLVYSLLLTLFLSVIGSPCPSHTRDCQRDSQACNKRSIGSSSRESGEARAFRRTSEQQHRPGQRRREGGSGDQREAVVALPDENPRRPNGQNSKQHPGSGGQRGTGIRRRPSTPCVLWGNPRWYGRLTRVSR